jgi:hypothetical protein
MSCDVAAAAFLLLASAHTGQPAQPVWTPVAAVSPMAAPSSVAGEPLFADIVKRAGALRGAVTDYRKALATAAAAPAALPAYDAFTQKIGELAALDQQGHVLLKARGTDGDLKCILHGISQDLPLKLAAVGAAKTAHDEDLALRELDYLLRDNVEVITAPPAPAV